MNHQNMFDADKAQQVHLSHISSILSPELESFSASFVKPCTYWSAVEKASFFASLSRHSRWKPDSIAEDIGGGKTVADVCSYIELLEQGSARKKRKGNQRDAYPIAHEVSEEWIAIENEIAAELCLKNLERQEVVLKRKRKRCQERREARNALRRSTETAGKNAFEHDDESNTTRNNKRGCEVLDHAESEAWEAHFKARKQALSGLWKREDLLSSLDARLLKAMDHMILNTLGHAETGNTMEGGDQSNLEDTREYQELNTSSNMDPSSSGDPSALSPTSRRRLRMRLLKRHKRARDKGLPASEVSLDPRKLKRGRKARPKIHELGVQAKTDVPGTQTDAGGTSDRTGPDTRDNPNEDEVPDDSELAPAKHPSGWAKLTSRQVSGLTLRSDGMDLFHLGKFGNLMSLLGYVHSPPAEVDPMSEAEASDARPSSVSYHLVQLLRACLVRFVTRLVGYVILHKDVETRQKQRTSDKFERGGAEKVTKGNVYEVLLHMGRETSTKQLFVRLKRTVEAFMTHAPSANRQGSDPQADESDDKEFSDDGSSAEETKHNDMSSMRSHSVQIKLASQTAFPPTYNDPQGSLLWNPSILSAFGGIVKDFFLHEETDESRLRKELKAEEQVEEADHEADRMHEQDLWMEVGIENRPENSELPCLATTEVGALHSYRFRRPGGAVKSKVYIDE